MTWLMGQVESMKQQLAKQMKEVTSSRPVLLHATCCFTSDMLHIIILLLLLQDLILPPPPLLLPSSPSRALLLLSSPSPPLLPFSCPPPPFLPFSPSIEQVESRALWLKEQKAVFEQREQLLQDQSQRLEVTTTPALVRLVLRLVAENPEGGRSAS
eukprot:768612-Hanusia_phi.AAC.9